VTAGSTCTVKYLFTGDRGRFDSKSYVVTFNCDYYEKEQGGSKEQEDSRNNQQNSGSNCNSIEIAITPKPWHLSLIAMTASIAGTIVLMFKNIDTERRMLSDNEKVKQAIIDAMQGLQSSEIPNQMLYNVAEWSEWVAKHLVPFDLSSSIFWSEILGKTFTGAALAVVVFNAYDFLSLKSLTDKVSWRSALLIGFLCGLANDNFLKALQVLMPGQA
jgi:hypothetical protein